MPDATAHHQLNRPNRWLKKLAFATLGLLVAAPAVFAIGQVAIHTVNRNRIDLDAFDAEADRLIERATELANRAENFDPELALRLMRPHPFNGPIWLLDEHLDEIKLIDTPPRAPSSGEGEGALSIEFDSTDTIRFLPHRGKGIIQDGALHLVYNVPDFIAARGDYAISPDEVGEIEIRVKHERGGSIEFAWAVDEGLGWNSDYNMEFCKIYVRPDGEFHTYRVDVRTSLRRNTSFGPNKRIRTFLLLPSDVDGDNVVIDFVRLIPKRDKYAASPFGNIYETAGREMRKVVYLNTPQTIAFNVEVPKDTPQFEFGLAALGEDSPINFKVRINEGGAWSTLFTNRVDQIDRWSHFILDLDPWSGKDIQIEVETASDSPNVLFWSGPKIYGANRERMNVIIVLEDALRADHLSTYDHHRETSPFKDKFFGEGIIFDYAFSQAPVTRTSCPSLMTSLLPTATGMWGDRRVADSLSPNYLTLARVLRSQGFTTAAFVQNANAGLRTALHRGYERFFDVGTVKIRAETMYKGALEDWLDENGHRNFYLYLHLIDPHGGYEPPEGFDLWSEPEPKRDRRRAPTVAESHERDRNHYDGEIRYNDTHFEGFITDLERRGLLDDTLIIFISDHGEYFGEHGLKNHGDPTHRQVVHVPLMMRYAKLGLPPLRYRPPVGLLDVMPTILDLAKVDSTPLLIQGESLIPRITKSEEGSPAEGFVISEDVEGHNIGEQFEWGSIFFGDTHFMHSDRYTPDEKAIAGWLPDYAHMRAYNYVADAKESDFKNTFYYDLRLKRRIRDQVRRLREENLRIWEALGNVKPESIAYDPEVQQHLKALGYLE